MFKSRNEKELTPKVTVLMSVYNGEKYLCEAIDSILNQTFTDFEFLIINDGSTDSSRDIIISYNDSRIRLIDNQHNIGLTASLNRGIDLAKGEYIARMDADDISLPERLEKQLEYMDNNAEVAVCGSWAYVVDETGDLIYEARMETVNDRLFANLFFGNQLVHTSVIMRSSIIMNYKYDKFFKSAQDYDLWFRLLQMNYLITNIPYFLLKYRSHNNNVSNIDSSKQEKYAVIAAAKGFQSILNINTSRKTIALFRKCINGRRKIILENDFNRISDLFVKMKQELFKKIRNEETQDYLIKYIDNILNYLVNNKRNFLQYIIYNIKENYAKKIKRAFV